MTDQRLKTIGWIIPALLVLTLWMHAAYLYGRSVQTEWCIQHMEALHD